MKRDKNTLSPSETFSMRFLMAALLCAGCALCYLSASAQQPPPPQFAAPKIDGVVGRTEYGALREGENTKISGGAQWFMTWDNAHLYIAVTGSNPAHAAVIYVNLDAPTGAANAAPDKGTATGHMFEIAAVKQLPFKADFVAYFKNDHREYRRAAVRRSGAAAVWGAPVTTFGTYAFALGTTRELAIPWAVITGGARPRSFSFFGYLVMTDGFVYGQVPPENARGRISTTAVYERYYEVKSTAEGAEAKPFLETINVAEKPASAQ